MCCTQAARVLVHGAACACPSSMHGLTGMRKETQTGMFRLRLLHSSLQFSQGRRFFLTQDFQTSARIACALILPARALCSVPRSSCSDRCPRHQSSNWAAQRLSAEQAGSRMRCSEHFSESWRILCCGQGGASLCKHRRSWPMVRLLKGGRAVAQVEIPVEMRSACVCDCLASLNGARPLLADKEPAPWVWQPLCQAGVCIAGLCASKCLAGRCMHMHPNMSTFPGANRNSHIPPLSPP
eukprot:350124-Chlamydomonas_euryale.AAC.2